MRNKTHTLTIRLKEKTSEMYSSTPVLKPVSPPVMVLSLLLDPMLRLEFLQKRTRGTWWLPRVPNECNKI
jgi:hypothetical protein